MIIVFGEGRGFWVVWLFEEMGLDYVLCLVDLIVGVEDDYEFFVINLVGFILVLQDGDVIMVELIVIMEYLIVCYGFMLLVLGVQDLMFFVYQQFFYFGKVGLVVLMYFVVVSCNLVFEGEK